jgi:hypothetical protein
MFIIMVVNNGFTSTNLTQGTIHTRRHGVTAVPMVLVAAKPENSMYASTNSTLGAQQAGSKFYDTQV